MRIVAGSAKGRTLLTPKDADTIRPTSDRVRETVFNILGQWCDGLTVVDLYAGTGALGLEAASRGAAKVYLVDSGREAQTLCRGNVTAFKMEAVAEVLPATAQSGISLLQQRSVVADLVFADPPYNLKAGKSVLEWLAAATLVSPSGRVVIEHSPEEDLPEAHAGFSRIDTRAYGAASVSFYAPDA